MRTPFRTDYVSTQHRFAVETDTTTGQHYLSIPVSNHAVGYEEQYRIDEEEFRIFLRDPTAALQFAVQCGAREMDDRLRFQPGSGRGVWG